MKTLNILTPISRSPWRCGFFILSIALCWFALSPAIKAACPNPPGVCGGQNTAVGEDALFHVTTGVWNVGVGFQALFNDTIGNQNTATGYRALFSNTEGDKSTAYGSQALFNNLTGNDNVANGFSSLFTNTTGNRNTGNGYRTLAFNNGDNNTAVGWNALFNNRTGNENTAVGSAALLHNNSVSNNTAVGFEALREVIDSDLHVAVGDGALRNFDGSGVGNQGNTALGSIALEALESGNQNVAVGRRGLEFLVSGSNNTAVGWRAGDNYIGGESGNITIGSFVIGATGENNTTRIGNILGTFQPFAPGVVGFVTVGPGGRLGNGSFSSQEYKDDIKPMDKASEEIFALKPVAFRYKEKFEPTHSQQYGLIAEDVVKVDPNLVVYDEQGKVRSVRYDLISNMLLNEFLKEHKKVEQQQASIEEQQASIADLKSTVALQRKEMQVLTAQFKEQAAQIQKVSAQVEVNKATPNLVLHNP